jgi:putative polyhydroxyalkanoate system protein
MANINIRRTHHLSKDDARQRVEDIARDLKQKLQIDYQWKGDSLQFKRSGAQGSIDLGEDFLEVKVKLGLLASAMKDKIESSIQEKIDSYLA